MAKKSTTTKSPLKARRKPSSRKVTLFVAVLAALIGGFAVYKSFAATASLTATPSASTVGLGNNFTVALRVNSSTDTINAVQSDLTFPTNKLQFVSIDAASSAFGVEAVSTGDNTTGVVRITRAVSGGSTVSGNQLIVNVTFKALATGSAAINFAAISTSTSSTNPQTAVLRSTDNTNILTVLNNASVTIADQTAPTTPGTPVAGTRTVNSIPLTWTASTDNVGVTGYKIFRGGTQVGTSATASYTDTGLNANTAYSYTVSAYDAAGNNSSQSSALATSTLPDTSAPTVPTGLTAPTKTMNSVSLTWTASTDNVAVTGYKIFRGGTQVGTSATTSYTDSGLTPNTAYSYTVSAYDAAGNNSAQTSAVSATTLADTSAPTVPTGLNVSSQSGNSISLTWTASTDNVAVTGYKIFRGGTQIGTSTTTSYTDTTAILGATYSYTVAANDAAGNTSAQSSATSVTVYKTGDINRDGGINIYDLSILLSNFGKTVAQSSNPNTDLNGSGSIDIFDLSILLSNFGT